MSRKSDTGFFYICTMNINYLNSKSLEQRIWGVAKILTILRILLEK